MSILHYSRILTFSLLIMASMASCQNNSTKQASDTISSVKTSQQIFWDSLPEPTGYVNDYEGIFASSEEDSLNGLIGDFEKRTTIQIAVVTLDSTMTTADSLAALTLRIANVWGVGQKDKNNGIVIGISRSHRMIRIQTGYGIEGILTNAETKQIIDAVITPKFIQGKFYEGVMDGIKAIVNILDDRYK